MVNTANVISRTWRQTVPYSVPNNFMMDSTFRMRKDHLVEALWSSRKIKKIDNLINYFLLDAVPYMYFTFRPVLIFISLYNSFARR